MTPSRVALRAVQTEELLCWGSGGFWQRWLCREGLRALSFGVRMANLGCLAPQQLHPELFPQCGQPGSCLCSEQMVLGEGRGGGWGWPHPSPVGQLPMAAVGSGSRAFRGLELLQLLALPSPCSLSLIRY